MRGNILRNHERLSGDVGEAGERGGGWGGGGRKNDDY